MRKAEGRKGKKRARARVDPRATLAGFKVDGEGRKIAGGGGIAQPRTTLDKLDGN